MDSYFAKEGVSITNQVTYLYSEGRPVKYQKFYSQLILLEKNNVSFTVYYP